MKKKEKDLDFDEIYERLVAGWYVFSGQRKRYLKSIMKDKKWKKNKKAKKLNVDLELN